MLGSRTTDSQDANAAPVGRGSPDRDRRLMAMKVVLTGATGFIGSHVLTELRDHGHDVTAVVRDAPGAETVGARGATPAVVDLYDETTVVGLLETADGAV